MEPPPFLTCCNYYIQNCIIFPHFYLHYLDANDKIKMDTFITNEILWERSSVMQVVQKSPYAILARKTLDYYLLTGKETELPIEYANTPLPKAAVFVSIKKDGENRGCQGSFAEKSNIVLEIIYNAIKAGTQDPRFWPVKLSEFPNITFSVDVLSAPEVVRSKEDLDPNEYGLIINSNERNKRKHGLLLPSLEKITTAEKQIQLVKKKAKILNGETYELYKFSVERHLE